MEHHVGGTVYPHHTYLLTPFQNTWVETLIKNLIVLVYAQAALNPMYGTAYRQSVDFLSVIVYNFAL